jgi:endonuclease/exonuclease/phosphatase family metal-dependent hydrolase
VLDAHPVSTLLTRAQIRAETQERAYTARVIAAFVRAQRGPVLVLADFNATDQSTPYRIVTQVLGDAWREGGVGFGHTFPGDDSFDRSRPRVRDWLIPRWLVRIDYVFHSRQWRTVEAHIGPWDGTSDHRPVCATLALTGRA